MLLPKNLLTVGPLLAIAACSADAATQDETAIKVILAENSDEDYRTGIRIPIGDSRLTVAAIGNPVAIAAQLRAPGTKVWYRGQVGIEEGGLAHSAALGRARGKGIEAGVPNETPNRIVQFDHETNKLYEIELPSNHFEELLADEAIRAALSGGTSSAVSGVS